MLYRSLIRPLLFLFDAEAVHRLVTGVARAFWRVPAARRAARLVFAHGVRPIPARLAGLELANPLGLAAGFDKDGLLVPGIESLGFGFVEVGTVTPRPQSGNPRPRLERIPGKRALLNRMGFNNEGASQLASRLAQAKPLLRVPLGINLGKNKETPQSDALRDYERLLQTLRPVADYFVINVSSPNTPGLRDLQSGDFLKTLGERIRAASASQPVFLKLSPDVAQEDLKTACALCGSRGSRGPYAGLVLTNTIPTDLGGLSGAPLRGPSTSLLKIARGMAEASVPIISVGGIETLEDVLERFRLGATAVQLFTGLIYEGPSLPGRILRELQSHMRRRGIRELSDLRDH